MHGITAYHHGTHANVTVISPILINFARVNQRQSLHKLTLHVAAWFKTLLNVTRSDKLRRSCIQPRRIKKSIRFSNLFVSHSDAIEKEIKGFRETTWGFEGNHASHKKGQEFQVENHRLWDEAHQYSAWETIKNPSMLRALIKSCLFGSCMHH